VTSLRPFVALALALAFTPACAKEKGRIPFTAAGHGSTDLSLEAGEVDFWTDLSAKYSSGTNLAFHVRVKQGGATVAEVTCDPLGYMSVRMSWVETDIGDRHSRKGSGKM